MYKIYGIHHVSSIVGHAQRNLDFNAGVLAQRLLKKTLNYDDKSHYHFYLGNSDGSTGLTTTFPWNDAIEGLIGAGQVEAMVYSVPSGSLDFWFNRLKEFKLNPYIYTRFGEKRVGFEDPDGLELELVERNFSEDKSWEFNGVLKKDAIHGIQAAYLLSQKPNDTLRLLTEVFGYSVTNEDEEYLELTLNDNLGGVLYLNKKDVENGAQGIGTVHHIALRVKDEEIEGWVEHLESLGYHPTKVKNRKYFKSVYFREKGGILIELATPKPGMTIDEPLEHLGESFIIPKHYEDFKDEIFETIMPVEVREVNELVGYGYRDAYEYEIVKKRESIRKEIEHLIKLSKEKDLTEDQSAKLQELRKEFINSR